MSHAGGTPSGGRGMSGSRDNAEDGSMGGAGRRPLGESLGKSLHDLKPDISAKNEAKKAQKQANNDIEESSKPSS